MIGFLRGKKTYLVGAGWIVWGVWTFAVEGNEQEGIRRVMEGVSLITLRAGVAKKEPAVAGE